MHKVVAIILPLVLAWTVGALGEDLSGKWTVETKPLKIDAGDILSPIADAVTAIDNTGLHHKIKVDREGYVLLSPCHKRLHEALKLAMRFVDVAGRGTPIARMLEKEWEQANKTLKECAP